MQRLFENFLNENNKNKELYYFATILNDEKALKKLENEFNDYLFKTYLYSYIIKSIKYTSYKIKAKRKALNDREKLILNVVNEEFLEERIYTIKDNDTDYIESITKTSELANFTNIADNIEVLNAINRLTDKQKEILYKCIILDLDEKTVAGRLKTSIQSVNKTKNTAIKNIRKAIGA